MNYKEAALMTLLVLPLLDPLHDHQPHIHEEPYCVTPYQGAMSYLTVIASGIGYQPTTPSGLCG
jgi:hypothetical protein